MTVRLGFLHSLIRVDEKMLLAELAARDDVETTMIDVRKIQFNLGHDVLRHTYVSMLVGAFRSVGDAALQAGNSEAIIRRYYLDLQSEEEADEFWRICPKGSQLPEGLHKKSGRYITPQDHGNDDGHPAIGNEVPSA